MKLDALGVYKWLLEKDKIKELQGQIKFYLGDVDIVIKQKDVVGNIVQEWLQGWLEKRNIDYAVNDNTQMPPDFFLSPGDETKNLLEVKAFNRSASPGFDIADFRMYAEEIVEKPYMLDVDYLIFGYDMSDDGIVTIRDLWIKKVWEITRRMDNWPLNLQVKVNVVHKIRPGVWYSTGHHSSELVITPFSSEMIPGAMTTSKWSLSLTTILSTHLTNFFTSSTDSGLMLLK